MIYDISMELKKGMVIYPGNAAPKIEKIMKMPKDSCNLSTIYDLGAHTGTHIDAPNHFIQNGKKTGSIPLEGYLIGHCKVFDLTKKDKCIEAEDLENLDIVEEDIILFKTKNSLDPLEIFNKDFIYLAPSAADFLVDRKINTIGWDSLSVEKNHSEDHYTHKTLLENDIVIIEGLRLKDIKPGNYRLTCLPLKIDADGAPVRAVLEDL